jgi:hypothetical protein
MDDWLAAKEKPSSEEDATPGDSITGVGVFYFEGAPADKIASGSLSGDDKPTD